MNSVKKPILAICDSEAAYVYRLLEYMNKKSGLPFEVRAFTDTKKLKEFGSEKNIALLLVDEHVLEDWMRGLGSKVVVLSEGLMFAEGSEFSSVYKYQSSEDIMREVLYCYGEAFDAQETAPGVKCQTELIAVYSPLRRIGRTTFALTLGQVLGERKRALYLNLEEYAGFARLSGVEPANDLADLMYFVREKSGNLPAKLSSMVKRIGALEYIPPAAFPVDLRSVELEDWEYLLQALKEQGLYEAVILDFGDQIQGLFELLDLCDTIYAPERSDAASKAKWQQYDYMLGMTGREQLLKKITRLELPRQKPYRFEELCKSPLADYVRRLLGETR